MSDSLSSDGTQLRQFERQLLVNYPWLVVVMAVLLVTPYAQSYISNLDDWDWLWNSGILVFLVAYPLSLQLPDRVVAALRELAGGGILQPREAVGKFEHRLNLTANRWASVGGLALAVVMGVAWLAALTDVPPERAYLQYFFVFTMPAVIVELALATAAGRFIGRALCYSTLGSRLHAEGIILHPVPDHVDRVGGLSPIGRIYLTQAMLVTLIAAFLSVWIVLFPVFGSRYVGWQLPYIGLLILMLVIEAVSLLGPLRFFKRFLRAWKQDALGEATALRGYTDKDRSIFLGQEYRNRIERMPTWVLDTTARWFLLGVNALLVVPLLLVVVGIVPVHIDPV